MAAPTSIGRRSFLTRRFGPRLKLFISYRHRFDQGSARLLKQELTKAFGDEAVFRDVERIVPGEQFPLSIDKAIKSSDVFLVVISPGWLEMLGDLQRPTDYVRMEIAAALARETRVIPILIGDACMPDAEELPADIGGLAIRNAVELSDRRWNQDIEFLIEAIRDTAPGPTPVSFVEAAFNFLFGTRLGRVVLAAVLLAAVGGLFYFKTWYEARHLPRHSNYEECLTLVRVLTPNVTTVEAGTLDKPLLRPDEYEAVRSASAAGVPFLLSLTDSGRDLGTLSLRYFKDGDLFKVEWVMEPPCDGVEQYVNDDRPAGDKHILQNWDRLRLHLGGRDYILRPGVQNDSVTVTLLPSDAPATPR